jgi:cytoskeletal protein CcmA (bactofilin family)
MASTYVNDLRLEEIGTGEASGTWGTKTNANLELIGEAFSYGSEAIANASTHTITMADGTSDQARSFYLKCTGGGQACTVTLAPNTVSKVWMIENATSATLTFSQGSGANVAVAAGEVKMIATDGQGSGAVVYDLLTDANLAGTTAIAALKLGGTAVTATADELNYSDTGASVGTVVASKVVTVDADKDVSSFRNITLTGELDAGSLDISGDADIDGTLETDAFSIAGTTVSATAAELNYNDTGAAVGTVVASKTVTADANKDVASLRNLTLTGELDAATLDISGAGDIDGALDVGGALTNSSAAVKVAGVETIYVPAGAMSPNTTDGCAGLAQVELSNGPELRCLDFDASSDENAQFTVCFPKSWNEGTITFQAFWTVTGTDTGTVAWGLSGVSIADDVSINTAFGTNVVATAKAFSGTSNDMTVSAVSGAVTVASAAVDTQTYFQIMRDVSADSQTGDARLLGIKLFYTTDAKNDA